MNAGDFDSELQEGMLSMAEGRWLDAEAKLSTRKAHGHQRLCLFLLSIAAASSGQEQKGNTLWQQAQQCPVGELTSRYLDLQLPPNDPRQSMLLDLERAWWNFNGWNSPSPATASEAPSDIPIDWWLVVDCTLNGDSERLESAYGRCFQNPTADSWFLWNLLALSYLEAGNVRTYEEMTAGAPAPPAPNSVPAELHQALESRGLSQALERLQQGYWLDYGGLSGGQTSEEFVASEVSEEEWTTEMANGFALLDLNQNTEATRCFQKTAVGTADRACQIMSLNALSLSFFKMGDYSQAETLYHEFQGLLEAFPQDLETPQFQRYRRWLESVGAAPSEPSVFFSPFDSGGPTDSSQAQESTLDFWSSLGLALNHLAQGQHLAAKRELQALEAAPTSKESSQVYLVTLTYLACAVTQGDHFEVQEFEQELCNLQHQAQFSESELQLAREAFSLAGLPALTSFLDRFEGGRPAALNPWQDLQLQ